MTISFLKTLIPLVALTLPTTLYAGVTIEEFKNSVWDTQYVALNGQRVSATAYLNGSTGHYDTPGGQGELSGITYRFDDVGGNYTARVSGRWSMGHLNGEFRFSSSSFLNPQQWNGDWSLNGQQKGSWTGEYFRSESTPFPFVNLDSSSQSLGNGSVGSDLLGSDLLGNGSVGNDFVIKDSVSNDFVGNDLQTPSVCPRDNLLGSNQFPAPLFSGNDLLIDDAPAPQSCVDYGPWEKACGKPYYHRKCSLPAGGHQYLLYYPQNPAWVYWYNPSSQKFWCACPTTQHPTFGGSVRDGQDYFLTAQTKGTRLDDTSFPDPGINGANFKPNATAKDANGSSVIISDAPSDLPE